MKGGEKPTASLRSEDWGRSEEKREVKNATLAFTNVKHCNTVVAHWRVIYIKAYWWRSTLNHLKLWISSHLITRMNVKGQQHLFFFAWPQEGSILTGLILNLRVTVKVHQHTREEHEWAAYITTEM